MSEKKERSPYQYLGWVTGLGFTMICSILAGLFFGLWCDRIFHTAPWGALLFLVLGMAAGGWSLYKGLMKSIKDDT
ncbi:MAG: AtpZ/AtpI family protein [Candidatus Eremiobacteraeota bacterium]|nr:AtpZ/AtpI family protein [Candidatus Eremiobacteraeota bacterium]